MIHFVSISGGKDSTATACLALERAQRRPMELRFLFADTGRGGRNFDLLNVIDEMEFDEAPTRCTSKYGLCE